MTVPFNPLMVALTDRSGNNWLTPDGVRLTVDYLSKHRLLGYKRATITATGPHDAVFELLETLRYGVKIYSATDPAVWLGLVEGVNIYDGENRVGLSLRDMVNRVAVRFSYVEPGTSTVGARDDTTWVDDLDSQGEFGIKAFWVDAAGMTKTGAEQLRDTFLADHSLPIGAHTYAGGMGAGGGAGEITASIECIGWIMTLGWEYYTDSSTTNTATSTQISNILSAAQFINSVAVETASGISTSRYRKGDETMLTELLALMEMGTTNGKTYQLAIDEARNVRVFETPASTTVSYRQRVDGQILSPSDEPINGYRVEAGTWIELKDALPGSVDTTWMRYIGKFLIEEVEWTASRPDKPRLTPAGTRGGGVSVLGGVGSGLTIPKVQGAISLPWAQVTDLPIRTLFSDTVVTGYSTYSAYVLCTNLGRLTHVRFRIDGTSNSTELTFTVPINDLSAGFVPYLPCMVIDNGIGQELPGCVTMDHGTNLVRAGKRLNAVGGFTASGRKFITGDFWVYSG